MFGGWSGEELRVALTLYTDAYIVRGSFATRQRRLSDILNQAEEGFLVLTEAEFERFGEPGVTRRAPFAQVNLAAVLFAVADAAIDPVPELRTPKVPETALISIPPFEVTGRIHLLPERDLRHALEELVGRFIPITDATFWSDVAKEPPRTAPMIAVNHGRAQILSPYGDADGDPGGG
jgi:hypothetical protein